MDAANPNGFDAPALAAQERMVEAILFACDHPLSSTEIAARLPQGCDVPEALARLRRHYTGRGYELVAGRRQYALRPPLRGPLLADSRTDRTAHSIVYISSRACHSHKQLAVIASIFILPSASI